MRGIETRGSGRTATQGARGAGLTASVRIDNARRKRGVVQIADSSREGAAQVILGVGMSARELGTGQAENGLDARCGFALGEQRGGNPKVRDAPVGLRETLRDSQTVQPSPINAIGLRGQDGRLVDGSESPTAGGGAQRGGTRGRVLACVHANVAASTKALPWDASPAAACWSWTQGGHPLGKRRRGFWLVNPASLPTCRQSALARSLDRGGPDAGR